mgnify:CR=1 FL=1
MISTGSSSWICRSSSRSWTSDPWVLWYLDVNQESINHLYLHQTHEISELIGTRSGLWIHQVVYEYLIHESCSTEMWLRNLPSICTFSKLMRSQKWLVHDLVHEYLIHYSWISTSWLIVTSLELSDISGRLDLDLEHLFFIRRLVVPRSESRNP